jgi:hypothetical protein
VSSTLDRIKKDFEEEKQRLYSIPMSKEEIVKVLEQYKEYRTRKE